MAAPRLHLAFVLLLTSAAAMDVRRSLPVTSMRWELFHQGLEAMRSGPADRKHTCGYAKAVLRDPQAHVGNGGGGGGGGGGGENSSGTSALPAATAAAQRCCVSLDCTKVALDAVSLVTWGVTPGYNIRGAADGENATAAYQLYIFDPAVLHRVLDGVARAIQAVQRQCYLKSDDEATVFNTTLLILGGDDAGLGAVWAAGHLRVPTLLILSHPSDIGGDFTTIATDFNADSPAAAGGWNYVYDCFARTQASNPSPNKCGDPTSHTCAPAPTYDMIRRMLRTFPTVTVLSGFLASPKTGHRHGDRSGSTGLSLTLVTVNGTRISANADFIVDGSPEGYGAAAFNLTTRLGREGRVKSKDPSRDQELWAGRRLFAQRELCNDNTVEIGEFPIIQSASDPAQEDIDTSMGASPVISLKLYVTDKHAARRRSAPWLMVRAPSGYDARTYTHFSSDPAVLEAIPLGGNSFRYSGKERVKSLPGWWRQPDGGHYLRNTSDVWAAKLSVEHRAFQYAVGAVWHIQQHIPGGWRYGFDNDTFATTGARFMLSDFSSDTIGGDVPVATRLYHRVLSRLECGDAQWGGQQILQQQIRTNQPVPRTHYLTKTEWTQTAVGFPLLAIDFHAVLSDRVSSPAGGGPEGCAFVVFNNNFAGINLVGIPAKILEPPTLENYLSPGAPCSTFMAQSSLRAGSASSSLGIASVARVAAARVLGCSTRKVSTIAQQYFMVKHLQTAIVFFESSIAASRSFWWEQLAGTLAIPSQQLNDHWEHALLTHQSATRLLRRYADFIQKSWVPIWFNDTEPLTKAELREGMIRLGASDAMAPIAPADANATALLCELRQAVAIAMLQHDERSMQCYGADAMAMRVRSNLIVFDSFQRASGDIGSPEIGKGRWIAHNFHIKLGGAYPDVQLSDSAALLAKDRWLIINATTPSDSTVLSVDLALMESSVFLGSSNIGLVFSWGGIGRHGFFGFRHVANGTASPILECVLRHPTSGELSTVVVSDDVWPLAMKTARLQLQFGAAGKHAETKAILNDKTMFRFAMATLETTTVGLLKQSGSLWGRFSYFELALAPSAVL